MTEPIYLRKPLRAIVYKTGAQSNEFVVSRILFDLNYHYSGVNVKIVFKTKEKAQEIKLACRNTTQLKFEGSNVNDFPLTYS